LLRDAGADMHSLCSRKMRMTPMEIADAHGNTALADELRVAKRPSEQLLDEPKAKLPKTNLPLESFNNNMVGFWDDFKTLQQWEKDDPNWKGLSKIDGKNNPTYLYYTRKAYIARAIIHKAQVQFNGEIPQSLDYWQSELKLRFNGSMDKLFKHAEKSEKDEKSHKKMLKQMFANYFK
jgi:hypothetical protein